MALCTVLLGACDLPRDAEGTLARVRETRVLRVGASANEPWLRVAGGEVEGPEAVLVRAFAQRLGAQVAWTPGAESKLVEALREHRLDLVVGGLTDRMPWATEIGVTEPYAREARERRVMATAPGENALLFELDRFLAEEAPRLLEGAARR